MSGDGDESGRRGGGGVLPPIGELTTHPGVSPKVRRRREVLAEIGSESLLTAGTMVDQFKVIRLLGKGGMGEVYLARDTGLGRKVALKVIHAGLIGSDKAEARFLFEARATARFNHPNIVTIYAVGTFRESPYVALEYLEGATFRERFADERPGAREAARLGAAVAEALAEAHGAGILHRDLKPDNVIIPRDGRVRVLDFGLARVLPPRRTGTADPRIDVAHATEEQAAALEALQGEDRKLAGTPAYMAPEQWCGNSGLEATDVWALGVMLHELVTGVRPYELQEGSRATLAWSVSSKEPTPLDPALAETSLELAGLVGRCLDKDTEARPSAREVADTLRGLLGGRRRDTANPYRGLQPFGERHAELFFGREAEIAAFLERIRTEPVLPLVGPSGAGKSSLIFAGVIPRLREQGSLTVLSMRPGADPFGALAGRLVQGEGTQFETSFGGPAGSGSVPPARAGTAGVFRAAAGEGVAGAEEVASTLREAPARLGLELARLAEEGETRVLLVVDQLEELFTLVEDGEERGRFLRAVCGAADDPQASVRVVFTVRDDFLGRLAVDPLVQEVLGRVSVIRNPGPEALAAILSRPLERTNYRFEDPELPAEMIAEVQGEPAALPLLQFAASTLWARRDRRRRVLLRSAYEAMGGVGGALAEHADSVLHGMSPAQVRLAREMLLRLVRPSRAGGPVARRVLPAPEVIEGLGGEARAVLERLVGARLITVRKRGPEGGEGQLELVHESLVSGWRQLAQWIDEGREEIAFLAEIGQAAELWEGRGRRRSEVWSGDALAEARRILGRGSKGLPARVAAFLADSERAERRSQGRRRLLALSGAITLALVAVVSVLVALALSEREQEAQEQRAAAEARRAEAQREGARAALGGGNPLEARARLRDSLELEDSLLARSLWAELSAQPLRWTHQLGALANDVAFSPDGATVAVAAGDFAVYLFDVDTMGVRVLRGHRQQVYAVGFSPDGEALASADMSGEVRLFDLEAGSDRVLAGHSDAVNFLDFRRDAALLATGSSDGTVRLWDLVGEKPPVVLEAHDAGVNGVAFGRHGDLLATGGKDGKIKIHDLFGGSQARVIEGHTSAVTNVAFSPDGTLLASGGLDHTVRVWDVATGAPVVVRDDLVSRVWDVAFSPDGRSLAAACWDRMIRVWPVADLTAPARVLEGHTSGIYGVAFSPDSRLLASAGTDLTLRLWDLSTRPAGRPSSGHVAQVMGLVFTPDSKTLASASLDRSIRLWDVADGSDRVLVEDLPVGITAMEMLGDGSRLAAASWDDGTVRLIDPVAGDSPTTLPSGTSWVEDLSISADDSTLATIAGDRLIRVWRTADWELLRTLETDQLRVRGVALDPSGSHVAASGDDGTIRVWDVARGREVRRLSLEGHGPRGLAFGPAGEWLVSGGINGQVVLWDPADGSHRVLGRFDGRIYFLDVHPDGTRVSTSGSDGVVRVWNVSGGTPMELRGHRGEVNYTAFSPDGAWIASSSDDGTVRLWNARSGRPAWVAPAMTLDPPRLLSHRGWLDADGAPASPARGPAPVWRDALEAEGVRAAFEQDTLCLLTDSGMVELWDLAGDRRVVQLQTGSASALAALPGSCLALDGSRARVIRGSGAVDTVEAEATAVAVAGGRVLVGGDGFARVLDDRGVELETWSGSGQVEAIGRVAGSLVLGFADGNLEIVASGASGGLRTTFTFEDIPSSPPTVVREGPMGTLVVGYASGLIGLWNPDNGQRLIADRLHGPVAHVALEGSRLAAASELGDQRVLDLSVFQRPYCELVREVWSDVPVVWRNGLPVPASPAPDHVCSLP